MLRSTLSVTLLAMIAAPAGAATYSATLSSPAPGRVVAREMNWACAGDTCRGATQESRPAVLCEALAKRVGRVASFVVDGRPFSGAELDKCNSAGKSTAATQAAAQ